LLTLLCRRAVLSLTTKSPQLGELQYAGISSHLKLTAPHVTMGPSLFNTKAALQGLPYCIFCRVCPSILRLHSHIAQVRTAPTRGLTVTQTQPRALPHSRHELADANSNGAIQPTDFNEFFINSGYNCKAVKQVDQSATMRAVSLRHDTNGNSLIFPP
jgi:hypothetical protein